MHTAVDCGRRFNGVIALVEGTRPTPEDLLLANLTPQEQAPAVMSPNRQLLIIAGAGSGKTEVMARRVAWWVAHDQIERSAVAAFTFTERAAEELKFRIREWISRISNPDADPTLNGMYVGTLHAFCIKLLRESDPDTYHNYEILDDVGRIALVQRRFHTLLGLPALQSALGVGMYASIERFLDAYDLLNEYGVLDVELPEGPIPHELTQEEDWCREAAYWTEGGNSPAAKAFGVAAARYYALLRCRRFLDFSTAQAELLRILGNADILERIQAGITHFVIDEVQDLNAVQHDIVERLVGGRGHLTAVGDHRQAIYGWRGGRVDLMDALARRVELESPEGVLELTRNFRSTEPIIEISNRWATTIEAPGSLPNPEMAHGQATRVAEDPRHVQAMTFESRGAEAEWIAATIADLVPPGDKGARHSGGGGERGIGYGDIAVLLRATTDVRTYVGALRARGVPVVFRAGPDLFSQPEVLLGLACLSIAGDIDTFFGLGNPRSLAGRASTALGTTGATRDVVRAAIDRLASEGLVLGHGAADRIIKIAEAIACRISGKSVPAEAVAAAQNPDLRRWLTRTTPLRRVFPQQLFQFLLRETGVFVWDRNDARAASAMFHLGQLSSLVTGIETPGWTRAGDFKYQVISLSIWGSEAARAQEAPLLTAPEAVTISTVHAAKGLEFAAVFVADVVRRRFPSQMARRIPTVPFDGPILGVIRPDLLADDPNLNAERRLLYVAMTRAERYLFVTGSTPASAFLDQLLPFVAASGAVASTGGVAVRPSILHVDRRPRRDDRLVTSFSDMRYFLECAHDFYLRKVLGFAPTIDQAFGYGRGVHNVLRAVHQDPKRWADLAKSPAVLLQAMGDAVNSGLFYLRQTTGEPADRMRAHARDSLTAYVLAYADELSELEFQPEREFETLLEDEKALISGAIDLVRLDDPPRVTIIDFKSGHPHSDAHALDEEEMRLQVTMYGLAAKGELELEPDHGLVRYVGAGRDEQRELPVSLDEAALSQAREVVRNTVRRVRAREFFTGPVNAARCGSCDFLSVCGLAPRTGVS